VSTTMAAAAVGVPLGRYNLPVSNEDVSRELLDMRAEDVRVRQEPLECGELGGSVAVAVASGSRAAWQTSLQPRDEFD